ncbi:MAG TPA: hypothetical protein VFT04_11460 [Gemmatimonadales bacterium]|nr:hypothetical protein [Gemmatimonadales bacterium]
MTTHAQQNQPSPEKQALIEAYEKVLVADAEKREKDLAARPDGPPKRRAHPVVVLSLLVLAVVGGYIGIARPSWIFERGAPAEPVSMQEASLRLAMAMQFQRIERFRAQSGRLPTTVEEAGPAMPGVRYQARHPDGFTLTGTNGTVTLTLQSTESLSAFVGNSYELIQGRSGQ